MCVCVCVWGGGGGGYSDRSMELSLYLQICFLHGLFGSSPMYTADTYAFIFVYFQFSS